MSPERIFLLLQFLSSLINSAVSQVFEGGDHGRFITNTESTVAHTVLSHLEGVKEPFSTGRGARPGNDCGNRDISQCTELLEVLTRKEIGFAATQKELNDMCPVLLSGLQCIDNYTLRCLNPQHRSYFNELYAGTIRVIKDLCNTRGQYQQEYIRHAPCMRQVHPKYNRCSETYHEKTAKLNKVNSAVVQFSETERRRNVITLCCSFQEYLQCSERIVYETCGNVTAQFTRQFLNRMAGPIVQKPCFDTSFITQHCSKSFGKLLVVPAVSQVSLSSSDFGKFFGDQPMERNSPILGVKNIVSTATEEDTNVECCGENVKEDKVMENKRKEAVLKYLTKYYMSKTSNGFSKPNPHFKITEKNNLNNIELKNNSLLINENDTLTNSSDISNREYEKKHLSSSLKENGEVLFSRGKNISGIHNNNSSLFVSGIEKIAPKQIPLSYNQVCGNNTSTIKRRRISNNGIYHDSKYQRRRNGNQSLKTSEFINKPLLERNFLLEFHSQGRNNSLVKFKRPLKIRHRKWKKKRKGKRVKFGERRFRGRNETLQERKISRPFPNLKKTIFRRKPNLRFRNCTATYENKTKENSTENNGTVLATLDSGSSGIFNKDGHYNYSTFKSNPNDELETQVETDWDRVDSSDTQNNHETWYIKSSVEFDVNTTLSQKEGSPSITDGVYYNVSLPIESITEKELEDLHKHQEYPEESFSNMEKLQFLLQTQIESIVFPAPEPKPLPVVALENLILQRFKNQEYFVPKVINIPEADFVSMKHPVQELLNQYKSYNHRPNSSAELQANNKNSRYPSTVDITDKSINNTINLNENNEISKEKLAQDSKGKTLNPDDSLSSGSIPILNWVNALLMSIILKGIS